VVADKAVSLTVARVKTGEFRKRHFNPPAWSGDADGQTCLIPQITG
jgi:hypothetical protein